jgi:hypothetical protein
VAKVSRRSGAVRLELAAEEAGEIDSLIEQLATLLAPAAEVDTGDGAAADAGPDPAADPADDTLAGLEWPGSNPVDVPEDPAMRRLLPDAYRDDPEAAAEFRRYTDLTLRDEMAADIAAVRTDLVSLAVAPHKLTLTNESAEAWLRVLNRLRLVLAVRLGIETAHDQEALEYIESDDPRAQAFMLYEWIGFLLGSVLRALR